MWCWLRDVLLKIFVLDGRREASEMNALISQPLLFFPVFERSVLGRDDLAKAVSLQPWKWKKTHWEFRVEGQEKAWVLDDIVVLSKTQDSLPLASRYWQSLAIWFKPLLISVSSLFIVQCLLFERRTFCRWTSLCVLQRVWDDGVFLITYLITYPN